MSIQTQLRALKRANNNVNEKHEEKAAKTDTASTDYETLELSKKGDYLFSIWVSNDVDKLYNSKQLKTASDALKDSLFILAKDKNAKDRNKYAGYELVHVSTGGVYPDYDHTRADLADSIFMDNTFKDFVQTNKSIQNNIMYSTSFDQKKFIDIASMAVNWIEEKTQFAVEIETGLESNRENSQVTLKITHSPKLKIQKVIFYINESAMYADLVSEQTLGRITKLMTYNLGLPFGKNNIRLKVLAAPNDAVPNEEADAEVLVNNTYQTKPTLHLLAIGIDEYPNLPPSSQLSNAVNDANLLKRIFNEKGKLLFNSKMDISPSILVYEQTTKQNIEKLIANIRKKVKPNDYFVMYVASHGLIDKDKYYFTPSDFSFSLNSDDINQQSIVNGFGEDQISEYLINIPTIFRMAILDTCHAGKEVEHIKKLLNQVSVGKSNGISILSAAKSTQLALDAYKGHGLFTYILGQGLDGAADYNHDDIVDSMEIAQYVQTTVGHVSRQEFERSQDAVVLPDPRKNYSRRFELTHLAAAAPISFSPNVFSPRESELYILGMQESNPHLMNGIIKNNQRHKLGESKLIPAERMNQENIIEFLSKYKNFDFNLLFDTDSTALPDADVKKVAIIAKALGSVKLTGKKILIEGHTDAQGDRDYNLQLSQKRAEAVKVLFTQHFGVAESRMIALGLGEEYPIADNKTEPGRAKNRRVSIFIYSE